ncbi:MAG: NUDIX hydrolase [Patescibacteria group bacterium]|nr:NUDIX hydrolase [Patescibacteria group bacterium]
MSIERPSIRQPLPPSAKKVFEGVLFDVYQWEQELYDGSKTIFEKLRRDDTVLVIPVLPDKRLLLNEDEQPGREPILTFPTGRMEKGETPESAALRELHEETGYITDELVFWKAIQPQTKMDWVIYFFIGRNCRKEGAAHADAGERISTSTITFEEMLALTDDSRYRNQDLILEFVEARYDAKKRAALEKLLFGE